MFTNSPPTDHTLPLPIVRAKPNEPLEAIVCNREFVGVETHYIGGRTILHSNEEGCIGCRDNMTPRWQGYVIVQSTRAKRFAVLQFTPIVGHTLSRAAGGANGLLGVMIRIRRLGNRINSPLECEITGYESEANEFPVYRLESIVRKLFGEKLFVLGD